ncbi:VOC family protein [Oceanicoccus sagamiensis]|uniref:Glyoxalase n=1 Tax=Oceanicoccus sagamiensis TaxID=716816 RepID=A0A1X9NC86_9GAMM|nr:VOC family protein [Oceanicoccus sagamiensis]ARN75658.1 glyoxalase [Oceanicoccus sagamiensis]
MISYVTVGTNDFARAEGFFNELLVELNVAQSMKTDRMIFWADESQGVGFSVVKPLDGEPATVGNGVMIALSAKDKDQVDRAYHKALSLGGTDEGEPGIRGLGFYVAYFRDLDGNKFNIFCAKP